MMKLLISILVMSFSLTLKAELKPLDPVYFGTYKKAVLQAYYGQAFRCDFALPMDGGGSHVDLNEELDSFSELLLNDSAVEPLLVFNRFESSPNFSNIRRISIQISTYDDLKTIRNYIQVVSELTEYNRGDLKNPDFVTDYKPIQIIQCGRQ